MMREKLVLIAALIVLPVAATAQSARLERRVVVNGYEVEFGHLGAIIADPDGRMYVADTQAQQIAVLDARGSRLVTIGRPGQGPGEFSGLQPTLAWSGENLVAVDSRLHRITLFDRAGAVVSAQTWSLTPEGAFPHRYLLAGGGTPYVIETLPSQQLTPLSPDRPQPSVDETHYSRYLRLATDGSTEEPYARREQPSSIGHGFTAGSIFCVRPDRAIEFFSPPFAHWGPLRAATPTGHLAVAKRESYAIDVIDLTSGQVLRSITRDVPQLPMSEADWEGLAEVRRLRLSESQHGGRFMAMGGDTPCLQEQRPGSVPVIRAISTDDQGRIWVESVRGSGFLLTVFSADGRSLAEAAMPSRDPRVAPFVLGNNLYIGTADELGVQGIEVYELVTPD